MFRDGTAPSSNCNGSFSGQSFDLRDHVRSGRGRSVSRHAIGRCHQAAHAVLVILVITALVGARVLQIFGVSLDAFSIAGGGVLSWIGFAMLRATHPRPKTPRRIELLRKGRS